MNSLTTTFDELLYDNRQVRPDKVALIDGDVTFTYEALCAEVDRIAAYLDEAGIKPGDRVIVHLRKTVAEVVAMFAIARVGGVVVNVNAQWTGEQLSYVANDSGAKLLIIECRAAKDLRRELLPESVTRLLVVDNAGSAEGNDCWDAVPAGRSPGAVARLDSELAMIIYTSGSTGQPKGVMLSHRNIVTGARSVARYLGLGEDDRLLSVLPYSFDYGLNQLTTMMLMGGTIVHQRVPMAAELVASIRKHAITGVAAVPPLWGQIVRLLQAKPASLPSLRRITNSGGKIPLNILERLPHVFPGVDVYLMYGLTEAFRSTYLQPSRFQQKMGSIGRAVPSAEVYVIKPGQGIAGPGEQGEVVHRGPLVSLGYWGKPEATWEKIRPCPELRDLIGDEPVVYSGDIVRVDEDGDLWFVARNDAMIKTSGFRVSPDEVEDLISRSGLVSDIVAFGVEDNELGQVVHVALSPLPGCEVSDIGRFCQQSMPHYMVPRRLHVWPGAMPRTSSGKIARPDVVRLLTTQLANERATELEAAE